MSCPHEQTTTLLWIYGEADDAHASHVAQCAICQQVLREHEHVHLALAEQERVEHTTRISEAPEIPAPANTGRLGFVLGVVGVCAAAAAVLLTWVNPVPFDATEWNVPNQVSSGGNIAMTQDEYWDFDGFGDELEDPFGGLEDDLAWLEEDLSTL